MKFVICKKFLVLGQEVRIEVEDGDIPPGQEAVPGGAGPIPVPVPNPIRVPRAGAETGTGRSLPVKPALSRRYPQLQLPLKPL